MVDLGEVVAEKLAADLDEVGAVEFELPDITTGERLTRPVAVLFTSACGKLLMDTYWSELWANWRQAVGWPKGGTFHSLRHSFATTSEFTQLRGAGWWAARDSNPEPMD